MGEVSNSRWTRASPKRVSWKPSALVAVSNSRWTSTPSPDCRRQIGRRPVPPVERPSPRCRSRNGRERPRLRMAAAVPRSSSGVAHAPRVSIDDVLGRVCEVPVQSDRERRAFPEKTASRTKADSVPDSASLLPLGRTRSAGCASAARCCQRFGIDRDAAHETQGVKTPIRS